MSMTRSKARRPRRPSGSKHDPDGVSEIELLDEQRLEAAHRRTTTPSVEPLVLVSEAVLLLRARTTCPHCEKRTLVHALMAMPEFETDNAEPRLLRQVTGLPPALDKAVREHTRGRLHPDRRARANGAVWLNHCSGCGEQLPEHVVLGSSGPFEPWTYVQRRAIKSERIQGPFALEKVRSVRSVELLAWLAWGQRLSDKHAAAAALQSAIRRRGDKAGGKAVRSPERAIAHR